MPIDRENRHWTLNTADVKQSNEVVTIEIGGSGLRIGHAWWRLICDEHNIDRTGAFLGDEEQLMYLHNFFRETSIGKYCPRMIGTDLDDDVVNEVMRREYSEIFDPFSYVIPRRATGCGNLFSIGFTQEVPKMIGRLLNRVRQQLEKSDNFKTAQVIHSISGGTGSSLTATLLSDMNDFFNLPMVMTYTLYDNYENLADKYNAVLALPYLDDFSNFNVLLSTKQVSEFVKKCRWLRNIHSSHKVVAGTLSNLTAVSRFPGESVTSVPAIHNACVPFPSMHFLCTSLAHVKDEDECAYESIPGQFLSGKATIYFLCNDLFQLSQDSLSLAEATNGKHIASSVVLRARKITMVQLQSAAAMFQLTHPNLFVEWIPNGFSCMSCSVPAPFTSVNMGMLSNNTAIGAALKDLSDNASALFDKRIFVHNFELNGVDRKQIAQGIARVNNIAKSYAHILSAEVADAGPAPEVKVPEDESDEE